MTDSLASCLHFIRLFWNHTLTWLSDKPSIAANWCLSAFVKYFCTWKRFSSPFRCKLENTARVQGLLGRRDRACPWIDWVHISDEVDGRLLLQLVKGSNKRNTDYFMEGARVWYLDTSCWRISQKTYQWVFWYKNECVNTVQSTFRTVICLFCTYCDFHPQQIFTLHSAEKISQNMY